MILWLVINLSGHYIKAIYIQEVICLMDQNSSEIYQQLSQARGQRAHSQ